MNAAGIDVSSRKSTVAVLRPFGEVVKLPFEVPHSAEGLALLAKQLKAIEGETRVMHPGDSIVVDGGKVHGCTCVKAGTLLDIFSPMREDFVK